MVYVTEDEAYKLWQTTNRSWESLYNLLYSDYYEKHKIGLDRSLEYKIMRLAQQLKDSNIDFPSTYEQFYQTLNDRLGGWDEIST